MPWAAISLATVFSEHSYPRAFHSAASPPFRHEQFLRGPGVLVLTAPEDQTESLAPLVLW
jgi:hypothetical protein